MLCGSRMEVNMKYTKLGNSELNVSRICMGCMGFGDAKNGQHSWTLDEEHSREIIKHGLELGINFFDTAIGYQSGTSEQYVGRALKDFAERDNVVVATKFLPRTPEEIAAGVTGQQHIEQMINTSLKNLGMDYVDLYIYHMWDYETPLYDIMDGLNRIVKAGKARYIGISNCFAYQLARANALAEKEGFAKFVSAQGHYNLIFREEEREMAKLCAEDNIAMTPYSALAGGRLSKHPGEDFKAPSGGRLCAPQIRFHGRTGRDYHPPRGQARRPPGRDHDGDLSGLASDKGDRARRGSHKTPSCGRRSVRRGSGSHRGGDLLAGGGVRASQAGGRDGAEYPRRCGDKHVWSTGNQEIEA